MGSAPFQLPHINHLLNRAASGMRSMFSFPAPLFISRNAGFHQPKQSWPVGYAIPREKYSSRTRLSETPRSKQHTAYTQHTERTVVEQGENTLQRNPTAPGAIGRLIPIPTDQRTAIPPANSDLQYRVIHNRTDRIPIQTWALNLPDE